MRPENKRMKAFLAANGIEVTPKYIVDGTLRGTWRLYNHQLAWTPKLTAKLTALGFTDFEKKPLAWYSGNGGRFSVFVHGHDEFLREPAAENWPRQPVAAAPEHSAEARDDENAAFQQEQIQAVLSGSGEVLTIFDGTSTLSLARSAALELLNKLPRLISQMPFYPNGDLRQALGRCQRDASARTQIS